MARVLQQPFFCVPQGEIYPREIGAGEDCPEELIETAEAMGILVPDDAAKAAAEAEAAAEAAKAAAKAEAAAEAAKAAAEAEAAAEAAKADADAGPSKK